MDDSVEKCVGFCRSVEQHAKVVQSKPSKSAFLLLVLDFYFILTFPLSVLMLLSGRKGIQSVKKVQMTQFDFKGLGITCFNSRKIARLTRNQK